MCCLLQSNICQKLDYFLWAFQASRHPQQLCCKSASGKSGIIIWMSFYWRFHLSQFFKFRKRKRLHGVTSGEYTASSSIALLLWHCFGAKANHNSEKSGLLFILCCNFVKLECWWLNNDLYPEESLCFTIVSSFHHFWMARAFSMFLILSSFWKLLVPLRYTSSWLGILSVCVA